MQIAHDQPPTIELALEDFKAVFMPARNYSQRTRGEYQDDIEDLVLVLKDRGITSWLVVGLRDLQAYMASLDRRGLNLPQQTARRAPSKFSALSSYNRAT